MLISVIIPVYKPKDCFWECLDSLCNQKFPKNDFEVILVLNGCKEPYFSFIIDYLNIHVDLQVKLFHTNEANVSNARNIGLDNANGEYITFVDSDDYVSPMYLKELYENVAPDTVSISNLYMFNDGGGIPYKEETCGSKRAYNRGVNNNVTELSYKVGCCFCSSWGKLINRSIIGDRRYNINLSYGEDSVFMFLVSNKIKKVSFTSYDAIYYYRRHDDSLSGRVSLKERISSHVKMALCYSKIYFRQPLKYNFVFFVTRLLGGI